MRPEKKKSKYSIAHAAVKQWLTLVLDADCSPAFRGRYSGVRVPPCTWADAVVVMAFLLQIRKAAIWKRSWIETGSEDVFSQLEIRGAILQESRGMMFL